MIKAITPFILILVLFAGLTQTSHAHDPGLSFASIQLLKDKIYMQLSFAEKDIETLLAMDPGLNGSSGLAEFDTLEIELTKQIRKGVDLRLNDVPAPAENTIVKPGSSKTVQVSLQYTYQAGDNISLSFPVLAQFSRGHRQHLTVNDNQGATVLQKILSVNSNPVFINNTRTESDRLLRQYFTRGVWHIWTGFDHILFLVTLLLPAVLVFRNKQWHSVDKLLPALADTLKVVTAFTLAHSITLGLAVSGIIQPPTRLVESVIAFSVLVTAVNNVWPVLPASRWLLAFGFGLIHGFGFSSVLIELGLSSQTLFQSLIGFNLGVEAGQMAVVVILIPVAYLIRRSTIYRRWIFFGGSTVAAMMASIWMFERISGFEIPGI